MAVWLADRSNTSRVSMKPYDADIQAQLEQVFASDSMAASTTLTIHGTDYRVSYDEENGSWKQERVEDLSLPMKERRWRYVERKLPKEPAAQKRAAATAAAAPATDVNSSRQTRRRVAEPTAASRARKAGSSARPAASSSGGAAGTSRAAAHEVEVADEKKQTAAGEEEAEREGVNACAMFASATQPGAASDDEEEVDVDAEEDADSDETRDEW